MQKLQAITDGLSTRDPRHYHVLWQLEKRNTLTGETETDIREGNILLTVGITELLNLLAGSGGTPFSAQNAHIAVGDNSNTAANASQTDLQGGNKARRPMEAQYPQIAGNQITWRAKFPTTDANFAWNEYGVANSAIGGVLLNRKVESLGTKTSADEWTLTITITLS